MIKTMLTYLQTENIAIKFDQNTVKLEMSTSNQFCEFGEENKITNICSAKIISPSPKPVYCDN